MKKLEQIWHRYTRRSREDHAAHVILTAWLWKKGQVRATWKKRYFKLTETELQWFSSEKATYAIGITPISSCFKVTSGRAARLPEDTVKDRNLDRMFVVMEKRRVFVFEAMDSATAYEWISQLGAMMLERDGEVAGAEGEDGM